MSTSPQYDFIKYRAQVNTVTEQFTALSRQVIDIIKLLKENKVEAIASLLEKLQATEKEKLEMVCVLLYMVYKGIAVVKWLVRQKPVTDLGI